MYLACHRSSSRINVRLQLTDWSDPTVANKLPQHMASSAGHVPKVPQALFLTRRATRNRHGSYSPKGDHMLFGILRQEAGLCQALYWISASVQAVCLFPRWAKLNVAPLCFSCLALDGMNPPQAKRANPSCEPHSCAPWSS